jgi:hypothetical protein
MEESIASELAAPEEGMEEPTIMQTNSSEQQWGQLDGGALQGMLATAQISDVAKCTSEYTRE